MNEAKVHLPKLQIEQLCHRYRIQKLSFFGSVLQDEFRPDSDVDILVEFEEGYAPGFDFFKIQEELSHLIGRKVELHTASFLSPYFRDEVINSALVYYGKS